MRDAGELFQRVEHHAVLEREALEDRAHVRSGRVRFALAGAAAVIRDRLPHVRRMKEPRIVRIEQRRERVPVVRCGRHQFWIAVFASVACPRAPACLQQPQPADVLEQARRPEDATLVGEIRVQRARA